MLISYSYKIQKLEISWIYFLSLIYFSSINKTFPKGALLNIYLKRFYLQRKIFNAKDTAEFHVKIHEKFDTAEYFSITMSDNISIFPLKFVRKLTRKKSFEKMYFIKLHFFNEFDFRRNLKFKNIETNLWITIKFAFFISIKFKLKES